MKTKSLSRLQQLVARLLLLISCYVVIRFLFLVFNSHHYSKFTGGEIAAAFLQGLRYDISALLLLNIPLTLLALSPAVILPNSFYNRFSHWLFLLLNIPFVAFNIIDIEYYNFTGRRLTIEVFAFSGEATQQTDQFIVNYWYLALIFIFFTFVKYYFSRRFTTNTTPNAAASSNRWAKKFFKHAGVTLAVLAFTVIGIRGGLQKKVLKPAHAYMLGHADLGALALNSTFTLLQSLKKRGLSPVHYFSDDQLAAKEIPAPQLTYRTAPQKYNVVVLILESMATEFWGAANTYKGYTPFLDSLAKKSLFFKNNFANGRRSIEALPSILLGVPSMMATPVAISNYQQNNWKGLAHILSDNGYDTSFFHGAVKGTMYFDAISAMVGLEDYHPLERYPEKDKHFDGNWGIYDEPFLQYMVSELSKKSQPFFSTVFTISTHQPYHVPPDFEGRFPKGTLKIHESVGYVDYAVKRFFEAAEKQPWFQNTLFVITADHTQMSESEHYNSALGGFMVPLLFYHPGREIKAPDTDRITQHTDILPSILDYVGVQATELPLFGRSVFDSQTEGEALLHLDGNYWLVRKNQFLQYNPANETHNLYSFSDKEQKRPLQDETAEDFKKRIQAYIQYFHNALIEDKLYSWRGQ